MQDDKKAERLKALSDFAKNGDLLLLQRRLGHKHLQSTMRYLDAQRWTLQKLEIYK